MSAIEDSESKPVFWTSRREEWEGERFKTVEDAVLGAGGVGAGGYNGEGGWCASEEAAGWSEANAAGRWCCESPGHG